MPCDAYQQSDIGPKNKALFTLRQSRKSSRIIPAADHLFSLGDGPTLQPVSPSSGCWLHSRLGGAEREIAEFRCSSCFRPSEGIAGANPQDRAYAEGSTPMRAPGCEYV